MKTGLEYPEVHGHVAPIDDGIWTVGNLSGAAYCRLHKNAANAGYESRWNYENSGEIVYLD